ncbi:MAG: DNA polymerase III subunit chi [Gammaproteobacteria bacterium]
MTGIEFHVLPEQGRRQHDVRICELIEQAWRRGRHVYVHCLDGDMAASLDELLWTFHDTSFVPHALSGTDESTHAPVILGASLAAPDGMDVLVNLHPEVPPFFGQFDQVIESTGFDAHTRQQARQRYRFYKDRGYPLTTHSAEA